MLRLNPSILSTVLSDQLLIEYAHLRELFNQKLLPLYSERVLNSNLQREKTGTIEIGSFISLFLTAYRRNPQCIVEVGTNSGNSALSMGVGASLHKKEIQLFSCDVKPCNENPLEGIVLPKGSEVNVIRGLSTEMFTSLVNRKVQIDMIHIDGRLTREDLKLLPQLINENTLMALDDCEGDEKGHSNLNLLRSAGLLENHTFITPFPKDSFNKWQIATRSRTGFLMPRNQIVMTRQ